HEGPLTDEYADGQLMPVTDFPAIIVNASSGHQRENKSWIIGRLLRDFEKRTAPLPSDRASANWEALRVSVFEWEKGKEQGHPTRDWVYYSGYAIIVLQISIAIIPLALSSEWATLVLVVGGIILASSQAALPQWRAEKWACPLNGKTISLTKGNGHRHVMVLLGSPKALELEILASGSYLIAQPLPAKFAVAILAAAWTVLLITVAGLKQGSWYLLAIGAVGMIQNIVVAASPRSPAAFGFHIKRVNEIKAAKVSKALMMTEQSYPGVGASLLPVFHPGGFCAPEDEIEFWQRVASERGA
ncbi:MAG: hypothetical protein Q9168_002917, partial [Polycauliona sp. 1 TL-2023]